MVSVSTIVVSSSSLAASFFSLAEYNAPRRNGTAFYYAFLNGLHELRMHLARHEFAQAVSIRTFFFEPQTSARQSQIGVRCAMQPANVVCP